MNSLARGLFSNSPTWDCETAVDVVHIPTTHFTLRCAHMAQKLPPHELEQSANLVAAGASPKM